MDHLTNAIEVVQTHQELFGHDAHERHRNALVVVAFNHLKKVYAKDFENKNEVFAVLAMVQEAIKQLNTVAVFAVDLVELLLFLLCLVILLQGVKPLLFHPVTGHLVKDLNFVESRVEIVRR